MANLFIQSVLVNKLNDLHPRAYDFHELSRLPQVILNTAQTNVDTVGGQFGEQLLCLCCTGIGMTLAQTTQAGWDFNFLNQDGESLNVEVKTISGPNNYYPISAMQWMYADVFLIYNATFQRQFWGTRSLNYDVQDYGVDIPPKNVLIIMKPAARVLLEEPRPFPKPKAKPPPYKVPPGGCGFVLSI